jgi:hypothetical protein
MAPGGVPQVKSQYHLLVSWSPTHVPPLAQLRLSSRCSTSLCPPVVLPCPPPQVAAVMTGETAAVAAHAAIVAAGALGTAGENCACLLLASIDCG